MVWPQVSRNADKDLAHYAIDTLAGSFDIALDREQALQQPGGVRKVAEALYAALTRRNIAYAREPYDPDQRVQWVRSPETILGGAREGTCLDLALLFAGLALGKDLAPLLVMLDGHALVALSLRDTRRNASDPPRRAKDGDWLDDGVLRDVAVLKTLIDANAYLAIECTGFAKSGALAAGLPESAGRSDGLLTFDAATSAGRKQLDYAARPFRFAIDLAVLRDRDGFVAYEPPLLGALSKYRPRIERLLEDDPIFGGRDDEYARLDGALMASPSGYVFVTGVSGSGKTAFLVNLVRRMLSDTAAPAAGTRLAYAFISRKYELAEEQPFYELLCEQLQRLHGVLDPLPATVPELQARYLELLARPTNGRGPLVVVVDGLDEAKGWSPGRLIFPRALPHGVHVVFAARDIAGRDWPELLGLDPGVPTIRLGPLVPTAVEALIRATPGALAKKADDAAFIQALYEVSTGDPFYLKFLVEDLSRLVSPGIKDLANKPARLDQYLDLWWEDVAKEGKANKSVRDLLTYLVAAMGPLARNDLADIDDADELDGFSVDAAVESVQRYVIGTDKAGYSLCHPRFHDYVSEKIGPKLANAYRDRLALWCETAWREAHSRYAATYVIDHLACRRATEKLPAPRSALTARMLEMVVDRAFIDNKVAGPTGLVGLERDFRIVIEAAASDPMPAALVQLVHAALAFADARRNAVRVADIVDAAAHGDLTQASSLLRAVAPDAEWLRVWMLLIAWICIGHDRDKARQFLADHAETIRPKQLSPTLHLLYAHVTAALTGAPLPAPKLPYPPYELPQNVSVEEARVHGLSIRGESYNPSMIRGSVRYPDAESVYLAEIDSPWLVAYASGAPIDGAQLVRQYIAAHASNPYRVYRNRSLWGILGAVLCHPDTHWALEMTGAVSEAALHAAAIEYSEALYGALTTLAARLGDAGAQELLPARINEARGAAAIVSPLRDESDSWGFHRRRLSMLAEALTLTGGDAGIVAALLDQAVRLPFGYAGFQAPANLTVADASFVCGRDPLRIDACLVSARQAAHNVQESRFCALTTSRVNAIARHWRPATISDLAATVERFVKNPLAAEFAPVHVCGEAYEFRDKGPNSLEIPLPSLQANTLATIALEVFAMPAASLSSLNPGVPPDAPLAVGAEVSVLDAGFAPLLAARFSAEILARRAELAGTAALRIASLIPIAAADATALDLMLARLLLAQAPDDPVLVAQVRALVPDLWMHSPVAHRDVET
ncbi:MAG TPA: ATP-binding protein [Burkholderiaceae bacterium]|nr:ATP-binding protein [Burkholderiaceae bacterium]